MATIYIKDEFGKEFLTKQLNISSARIITPDMQEGTAAEGEFGAENIQEEINLDDININSAPGMLLSATVVNAITQYIETTIQSFIAGNAQNVLEKIGINQETLEMTNKILGIIDSATFKIDSILKFVPTNIRIIPDTGGMTTKLCTSLKDMYMAIWLNLQQEYYKTINDAITNLPTTQEALKDSLVILQSLAENLINEQCRSYTGKSLVELRYMCAPIIQKYKEYKEKKALARKGRDEITNTTIELNTDTVKDELMNQLNVCSDLLYNSFMILEIKESIENIIQLVNEFNNIDLNSLTEGMNTFEDFMELLVEMGVDQKSNIITLKDAIKSGINTVKNNFNGLTAQLASQALSSAAQIAIAAYKNTSINEEKTYIQNYSFDLDLNTNTLFIIFDKEPTTKHIIKNLTSALRNAENNEKEKVFNAYQVQEILNLIDKGVFEKKDQEQEIGIFNIRIKFNLDDYNKQEETIDERLQKASYNNFLDIMNEYYDRLDEINAKRQAEAEETFREFELGIITEEYTADPLYVRKRPTLQLVHELFGILQEFFPILKIIITLVSNYKINKAKVQNNSKGNLFGMIRFIAKVANLAQSINLDTKNFYTVRTLKTYHYINQKIKSTDSSVNDLYLNNEETISLYTFLKENNLDTTNINTKLDTMIYFDMDSINEQQTEFNETVDTATGFFGEDTSLFVTYPESKYKDGTIMGLDKIQQAGNEIYYTNSSLPVISSQIMRSYGKNLDVSV